jgi:hypothetical protein
MKIFKKFVSREFVQDKFDRKYAFDLKKQSNGYFKNFGDKNPDKIFYVIWREWLGSGFFANFTNVLSHIQRAEDFGMIPVVDFENFKTLYNEKNPIHGTKNAWEYYFKQPAGYSLEEVYSSKNVFFCNGETPPEKSPDSAKPSETIHPHELYKNIWKKYAKLQKHVEDEIEKYSSLIQGRVLGIHFRGKEMNYAQLHWFAPTLEQMFRYTDEILEKYNIDKIFIVTEEKDYMDAFIAKYGDKVLYTNAFRVSKVNAYNLNPRKNHRYLLGLEILCESILLSRCTGLLCGDSGVSGNATRLGNHEFLYYVINGKNSANRYIARYLYGIKKLLPKKFGGLLDEVKITFNNKK